MAATPRFHRSVSSLDRSDRVVICGAGPAGLTAAYLLAEQGYAVTVLESDHVVGGISRTAQYKEYRFDNGDTTIKTLIDSFHYPRLGPGQMWEMCARKIEEMGER